MSVRLSDAALARRYSELRYRMIECALDPEHPATLANRARWTREFRQIEAAADRRGLLAEKNAS